MTMKLKKMVCTCRNFSLKLHSRSTSAIEEREKTHTYTILDDGWTEKEKENPNCGVLPNDLPVIISRESFLM